jgi:hypothetical protein
LKEASVARTRSTVTVAELPAIVADETRGIISIVGTNGGLSRIAGYIEDSNVVFGALSIKTEHGTIYLDPDSTVEISEEDKRQLPVADLEAINDDLTQLLSTRFGWTSQSGADDTSLDDLSHLVAAGIIDILRGRVQLGGPVDE